MATVARFKLPDVGEGLTEAEMLHWAVAVGDAVEVNQILCEIETAKSAVELPSPVAGVVETLHVAEGDTVAVGTVIISFRVGGPSSADAEPAPPQTDNPIADDLAPAAPPVSAAAEPESTPEPPPDIEADIKILVGTGPSELAPRRRHLRPRSELPETRNSRPASTTRVPIKGVRKAVATAMTTSAFTAPHVTEWLSVDVTETMALVRSLRTDPQWAGVRVNPMLFVARALLIAVERHPAVNAHWDEDNQEIVYHGQTNLGIAAATPRGLIVPNIKNAGSLGLPDLAAAIEELVETARSGRATPADMSGGTITITNIGALGVDAGTPILNPGEAAILAFGAVRPTPWVVDGQITIRDITQLALSFDHRLVDGELGSQVLTTVAGVLNKPVEALLYTATGPG
ncbi:dihydrolipoamide acetyltransferase family protein [Mycobacterium sp. 48b]|uniref:dihydrolipoamide acetyltransferase family protein n=1 Tax=Mycobacterium sp. 48b TaxID=3400426 RepID=UPI003AAC2BE2